MSPLILPFPCKKPKMSSGWRLDGDDFHYGFAAFGNNQGLAFGLDFIHDCQTPGFEFAGCHCLGFHRSSPGHDYGHLGCAQFDSLRDSDL